MGTYVRTGHNSYRLRERSWALNADGSPAGFSDFKSSAEVAEDGSTWSGKGVTFSTTCSDNVVLKTTITYTAKRFSA